MTSERRPFWASFFDAAALWFFVEGEPSPAPRPRVTKYGAVYYPAPYPAFVGELQRKLAELHQGPAADVPLLVGIESVRERPKSTKLLIPRGDVDNLAKGPLDAATKTGRFWADDVQIQTLITSKRWTQPGEKPGVLIAVQPSNIGD